MNDSSFQKHPQEDGTQVYPMGSQHNPWQCEAGMAANQYGC
ncbi:MAG: hypothetical protein JWR83_263 [Aeromicrobium sp.]|nr:hypothetical protein [Aeromicrobium sp.]